MSRTRGVQDPAEAERIPDGEPAPSQPKGWVAESASDPLRTAGNTAVTRLLDGGRVPRRPARPA